MEEAANDVNISNARLTWGAREILRNILLDCLKISEHEYKEWHGEQVRRETTGETGELMLNT